MIYKNNEIPLNFNKIAEYSDNYVVWVRESILNSGSSYNAYIQYFNPSFYYIYTDDYKIKQGTSYSIDYNYVNANWGSYMDNADISYSLNTIEVNEEDITYLESNRADIINVFLGQFLCCVCVLWIFKQLSRLFFRGGLS